MGRSEQRQRIEARRRDVQRLHLAGLSAREIARQLGFSATLIARDVKALSPNGTSAPRVTSAPVTTLPVDTPTSWTDLRGEAIGHLRAQAVKSSAAARELGRLAVLGEASDMAAACEASHVDTTEYDAIMGLLWDAIANHFQGPFVAQVRLHHGVAIHDDVEAALEDIRLHVNHVITERAAGLEPVDISTAAGVA